MQRLALTGGRLFYVTAEIPGITLADAFDANDVMGTQFAITVPKSGAIVAAYYHDLDDEGTDHNLFLFREPVINVPASDAAVALLDQANTEFCGRVRFLASAVANADFVNNQVQFGHTSDLPLWYVTSDTRQLWCLVQALGADNIAAANVPRISLVIQVFEE